MDDEFQVSSAGVATSVPVLTRDGEQFGILEHVLAVEEEHIFEGIVVLSANAIDQAVLQGCVDRYGNQMYGTMFGRAQWRQE